MNKVRFSIDFTEHEPDATGIDTVRFLMSANAGEDLKPIHKIASGGELARIMLALKNVLAEQDHVMTMVFDEVDTGVSGRAARDAGIHLVKDHRHHMILLGEHVFEREHDARELAARGDLVDGLEVLARVRAHEEAHRVDARRVRLMLCKVDGKADLVHVQLAQLPQNALLERFCRSLARVGKRARRGEHFLFLLGKRPLSCTMRSSAYSISSSSFLLRSR